MTKRSPPVVFVALGRPGVRLGPCRGWGGALRRAVGSAGLRDGRRSRGAGGLRCQALLDRRHGPFAGGHSL